MEEADVQDEVEADGRRDKVQREPGYGETHARGYVPDPVHLDIFSGLPTRMRRRMYIFSAAKVVLQSGFIFLIFSSTDLVIKLMDGDQAQAVSLMSMIDSAQALIDFGLGPLAGELVDAYGRKPFILAAPLCLGCMRLLLASRPSVFLYTSYRMLGSLVMLPFWNALACSTSDLFGRGSALSILFNRRVAVIATLTRMVLGQAVRGVRDASTNFKLAGIANLLAWVGLLLSVRETLPSEKRKTPREVLAAAATMERVSPLSFLPFFGQSPGLRALAVLMVCQQLPAYNTGLMLFRRHKHGWSQSDQSTQLLVSQACGVLGQLGQGRFIKGQGLYGSQAWGQRLGALMNVNNFLSPTKHTFFLNPLLMMARNGQTTTDRIVEQECVRLGIGQAKLEAARASLGFPASIQAACTGHPAPTSVYVR